MYGPDPVGEEEAHVLWWKGLAAWYNNQDFRLAMRCWAQVLQQDRYHDAPHDRRQPGLDDRDDEFVHLFALAENNQEQQQPDSVPHRVTSTNNRTSTFQQTKHRYPYPGDEDGDEEEDRGAQLALFLAGCYLDAAEFESAEACLILALQRCSGRRWSSSDIDDNRDVTRGGTSYRGCWNSTTARTAIQEYLALIQEQHQQQYHASADGSFVDASADAHLMVRQQNLIRTAMQAGCLGWVSIYQRPGFLYPLPVPKEMTAPGNDKNDTSLMIIQLEQQPSWCRELEDQYPIIRQELDQLLSYSCHAPGWAPVGSGTHRDGAGQHDGTVVQSGSWTEWVLFGAGAAHTPSLAPRTRQWIAQNCPEAVSLAEEGGGEVIFSRLAPQTRIQAHCGSTNLRWTAHLGLVVPSTGCAIRVGPTWTTWHPGQVLVFDDSFEHEVRNDHPTESRIVLLLRFWHPAIPIGKRPSALQAALQAKHDDHVRRCNPPTPVQNLSVKQRGWEQTHCHQCRRTGYESIRLVEATQTFVCICGQLIASPNKRR